MAGENSKEVLRSAIIGCGGIAQVHAEALSAMEQVQLTVCADIRPERAEAMAQQYGCRAYASMEELLEREQVDVVHLCTPHVLHTPMAAFAMKKGLHVFTEKPPVITREQWAVFSALASEKPRLGVCFQNRYNKSVRWVEELLHSGRAGNVLGARAFVTWCRGKEYYTESGWRGVLSTEGGGVLINQSIHTLDLLVRFLGRPLRAEAGMANHHLKGSIEVEDTLEAYVEFSGASAVFYATTAHVTDSPVLLELCCEKGTVRMEEQEITCLWKNGDTERLRFELPAVNGKAYWGSSHRVCIADFYRCIRSGDKFCNDISGVKDTAELMLAVYESAREHRVVAL